MVEENDAATAPTREAVEEDQTSPSHPDDDGTSTEGQKKDPACDRGAPAEDAANAAAAPAKRKSHRPSLEVVEVTVDSFYDKGAFKQELQVGTEKARDHIG